MIQELLTGMFQYEHQNRINIMQVKERIFAIKNEYLKIKNSTDKNNLNLFKSPSKNNETQ
jgi:hypothetical protein